MKARVLPPVMSKWDLETVDWFCPRLNLAETDEDLVLTVEVPGVAENDLNVDLRGDRLLFVSGKKLNEHESEVIGYRCVERHYGSFDRGIELPCEVDRERTVATIKDGVLTVLLPKIKTAPLSSKSIVVKRQ